MGLRMLWHDNGEIIYHAYEPTRQTPIRHTNSGCGNIFIDMKKLLLSIILLNQSVIMMNVNPEYTVINTISLMVSVLMIVVSLILIGIKPK